MGIQFPQQGLIEPLLFLRNALLLGIIAGGRNLVLCFLRTPRLFRSSGRRRSGELLLQSVSSHSSSADQLRAPVGPVRQPRHDHHADRARDDRQKHQTNALPIMIPIPRRPCVRSTTSLPAQSAQHPADDQQQKDGHDDPAPNSVCLRRNTAPRSNALHQPEGKEIGGQLRLLDRPVHHRRQHSQPRVGQHEAPDHKDRHQQDRRVLERPEKLGPEFCLRRGGEEDANRGKDGTGLIHGRQKQRAVEAVPAEDCLHIQQQSSKQQSVRQDEEGEGQCVRVVGGPGPRGTTFGKHSCCRGRRLMFRVGSFAGGGRSRGSCDFAASRGGFVAAARSRGSCDFVLPMDGIEHEHDCQNTTQDEEHGGNGQVLPQGLLEIGQWTGGDGHLRAQVHGGLHRRTGDSSVEDERGLPCADNPESSERLVVG